MSKRDPILLLSDIIESAEKIFHYTASYTFEDFIKDDKTMDAVVRNLEIIGEAANRLPDEFKKSIDTIDWHKIRGLRNRIIHHYSGIDYQIIWLVKEEFLPQLVSEINLHLNK